MTGQEECVEALLQRGAGVHVKDIRGRSPLHLASACGRVGALGALLQTNSASHTNTHLADNQGYTPLHWACYNGTDNTTMKCQHKVRVRAHLFVFPYDDPLSSSTGYDACVEVLLDHEAFRTIKGNSFSPLHCAV